MEDVSGDQGANSGNRPADEETDKRAGELTNRFGTVVEHMVVPKLLEKFKTLRKH
jgi:hypothetical protein